MLCVAAMFMATGPSLAHAALVDRSPEADAALDDAPSEVVLTFSEPVTVPSGGVRVFDADATRVDAGMRDTGVSELVAIDLPADLPDGGYVVTWRVISADSHPVSGVWTFTVGDVTAVEDALVEELFGGTGRGAPGVLGPMLRGLAYLGALAAAGALLLGWRALHGPRASALTRPVVLVSAATAVVASLAAVVVQAMATTGYGPLAALRPPVLVEVAASSFGQSTGVRVVWLVALLILSQRRAPIGVQALAGVISAVSFALDGHQRSVEPALLLSLVDVVHLAAGAVWFGGLVLLLHATRSDGPIDGPDEAARLLGRFSNLALGAVAVVAVTGGLMSVPLVGRTGALSTTPYGLVLVAKVAAVVAVVAIAAYNRYALVPLITRSAADGRASAAWSRLGTTIRLEAAILVAVVAITGALVSQQPASQAAGFGQPAFTQLALDDELTVDLVIEPNRVGLNTIHVYVLDPTGRPSDTADDLVIELTYLPDDIGPFRIEPFFAGTGHWIATVDDLAFAGPWRVELTVGLDRFTEVSTDTEVVVNP